jgi:putative endopeptidase
MTRLLRPAICLVVPLLLTTACSGNRAQPAQSATPAATQPAAASGDQSHDQSHDIDRGAVDSSVVPGNDFFRYANGGWLQKAEIPPDRSSTGVWSTLFDLSQKRTHELFEQLASAKPAAGSDEQRIGDYYATFMDEQAIEKAGLAPLRDELATISAMQNTHDLAVVIGKGLRSDVDALNMTNFHTSRPFGVWITQDLNNPTRNVPYLLQGGLGMPDRDYYLDKSDRMEMLRGAYRTHVATVLKLANVDAADQKASAIFDLEHRIAIAHSSRTESVDVLKANNPWKIDEFARKAPGLDWPAVLAGARLDRAPAIIVWHPGAVAGMAKLVSTVPLSVWRDYLTFHAIDRYTGVLPKAFADEGFNFYGKVLSGTPQQQDRWKRAVNATNGALPWPVAKIYVQHYFPPAAKAQLQAMVTTIVAAFDKRLDALTWMSPKTKAAAKAKLTTLKVGVGYPDTWPDYSRLTIVRGDAVGNAARAEEYDYEYNLAKLGAPPDHGEWWLSPQIVNAVNLPLQNALNFPAAILEPPFYDPMGSAAARYGSIGAIIGHEISHSFDDQGSQFDASGKLQNWWTPEDLAHFKAASATLVAQYNAYMPFPDLHENGQLTLSENIADIAGLSASYDAYHATGGSDDKTFFLAFAQSWRSKEREQVMRQQVIGDGHALDEYRADTVRNMDAWYAPFAVKEGQRLYLSPSDRVRVW